MQRIYGYATTQTNLRRDRCREFRELPNKPQVELENWNRFHHKERIPSMHKEQS